jgi:hypothetical protein
LVQSIIAGCGMNDNDVMSRFKSLSLITILAMHAYYTPYAAAHISFESPPGTKAGTNRINPNF